MPNNTELFNGLDSIVFDQPKVIEVSDFNKTSVKIDETIIDSKKDDSTNTKKVDDTKDDNFINPSDFFDKVKDNSKEDDIKDSDLEKDIILEDNTDQKPEDVIKTWADYFKENELLVESDLEGFDGSMENLIKAFQLRENRVGLEMVDDYKSQLPAEIKFLADNWEEGVPLNELINIRSNQLRYSKVTDDKLEESIDTQKAVYAEYLRKTTKYSDSKIEKEVSRLTDLDELKDESKDALKELKKFEAEAEDTLRRETKKEQETRKVENAKTIKTYEKVIKDTKEIVPGLKLTEKEQIDILGKIINPIGIDGYGNPVSYIANLRNEDPYKFDTAITYIASLTKGFTDWSKIIKSTETKVVKDLESKLNTPPPKTLKDNIKTNSKSSLLSLLEKNKGIFNK